MARRDIDDIIEAVAEKHPQIAVQQLQVKFPADDDGLWFFKHPSSAFEVQLESSNGVFPFLVETDRHDQRGNVSTVAEAVGLVEDWLGIAEAG